MKNVMKNMLFIFGLLVATANLNAMEAVVPAAGSPSTNGRELKSALASGIGSVEGLWEEDNNNDTVSFHRVCKSKTIESEDIKTVHALISKIDSTITSHTILKAIAAYATKTNLVAQLTLAYNFLTSNDKEVLVRLVSDNKDFAKQYIEHRLIDAALKGSADFVDMLTKTFEFDETFLLAALTLIKDAKSYRAGLDPKHKRSIATADQIFDRVIEVLQPIYDSIQSTRRMELEAIRDLASFKAGMAKAQRKLAQHERENAQPKNKVMVKTGHNVKQNNVCCTTCCGSTCCPCWIDICRWFSSLKC